MSYNLTKRIIIIGTGPMAIAYARVLKSLNQLFEVIGRGEESAQKFYDETNIKPILGGIDNYLEVNINFDNCYCIIATSVENLMPSLLKIMKAGAASVLIEKPGALSIEELRENSLLLENYPNQIFVAYNRRFYSSVLEAEKLIKEDGGLRSIFFEFTEWSHKIDPLIKAAGVKENWFFANSTHVVDLAFYFAGKPRDWESFTKKGSLEWHEKSIYAGAGITNSDILFSYLSDWESAGRWNIELLTKNRRLYLKPLESIYIQKKGSVVINEHTFDNELDQLYKPGLYKQVQSFLDSKENIRLKSMEEHIKSSSEIYAKILG